MRTPSGSEIGRNQLASTHWWPRTNTVIVGAALGWVLLTVVLNARDSVASGGDAWQQGDWLIDYSGGPVRRGLVGTAIMWLAPEHAVSAAAAVSLLLLAVLLAIVFALFLRTPRTPAWAMLVLSPAFMLFPAMYPEAALRKELIALVGLAVLAFAVRRRSHALLLAIGCLIFSIGALAHEASLVVLPAVILLLWVSARSHMVSRSLIGLLTAFVVLAQTLGVASAALLRIDTEGVDAVCRSWTHAGIAESMCSGSLAYLNTPPAEALRFVSQQYPGYFNYVPLVFLSLLPLILLRPPRSILLTLGATALALVPLMLLGIDYGRWIYLGVSSLSLVSLGAWSHLEMEPRQVPGWAAVAFVLLWSLPFNEEVGQASLAFRWLDAGWSLLHEHLAGASGPVIQGLGTTGVSS